MALSISRYFEKLFLPLNFICFEAHSLPMAVLVRTLCCVTVGQRGQYRKYLTGLAGYFVQCYKIIDGEIDNTLFDHLRAIVYVCAMLTNFEVALVG